MSTQLTSNERQVDGAGLVGLRDVGAADKLRLAAYAQASWRHVTHAFEFGLNSGVLEYV